jgi:GNAT superfamily N-acetyltransferase
VIYAPVSAVEDPDARTRARAWRDRTHAAVCDVIEPWEHGTIVRSTRHPNYYDFNLVRVEDAEPIAAAAVVAVADRALAGLQHRRVNFDFEANAQPLIGELQAAGWTAMRVLCMRHDGSPVPAPSREVVEVPYDAVGRLRVSWHHEHSPGSDPTRYHRQAREIAMTRGVVLLAAHERDSPVGYAQLERDGDGVEVTQVYVHPTRRGQGIGTALVCAAIASSRSVRDLWISADRDDRPVALYARLGFRPVWATVEFQRVL